MMLEIVKFAFKGIAFTTHTTTSVEDIVKRLKRYSFTQAVLGKTNGIVAHTHNQHGKLYRFGVPFLILGKPVLYVQVTPQETGTLITGRFTFPIYSRVLFWLGHIAVLVFFCLGIFRMIVAQSNDEPMLWYIYGTLAMLLGGMLGFLLYSWFSWTWWNRQADMAMLAECLELVLQATESSSNTNSQ